MTEDKNIQNVTGGGFDPLTLFLHIPKTGGSSLTAVLNRQYHADELLEVNPRSWEGDRQKLDAQGANALGDFGFKKMHPADIAEFSSFADNPLSRAITGHFPFGIHEHTVRHCRYITLMRKPEALIVSLYHEMFRSDDEFDVKLAGRFSGLAAFAEKINNVQTFILSGLQKYGEMLDDPGAAFGKAKKNIDTHFLYIGLQEQFTASVKKIAKKLEWNNEYKILQLKKGNYNSAEISDEIKHLLTNKNELDKELYAYAEQKFKTKFLAFIR